VADILLIFGIGFASAGYYHLGHEEASRRVRRAWRALTGRDRRA
jgi:hypothetical protein